MEAGKISISKLPGNISGSRYRCFVKVTDIAGNEKVFTSPVLTVVGELRKTDCTGTDIDFTYQQEADLSVKLHEDAARYSVLSVRLNGEEVSAADYIYKEGTRSLDIRSGAVSSYGSGNIALSVLYGDRETPMGQLDYQIAAAKKTLNGESDVAALFEGIDAQCDYGRNPGISPSLKSKVALDEGADTSSIQWAYFKKGNKFRRSS